MIDLSDNRLVEERYNKNFAYYRDYSDKIESDRKIEENTAKEYKGREILEFLQNAADAAKNREGNVRLSLIGNQLIIENSGNPFNIDGIRSLFSANFSIKRVKKSEEFIGYKGLGFRSILNFSKDIKIFSEKLSIGYNLDNVREFQKKLVEIQPEIIDLLDLEEDEIFLPFFCAPKVLNEDPKLSEGMCTKIVAKVEPRYIDDLKKQIKKIGEAELIFNNSLGNITVDLEKEHYEINLEVLNKSELTNSTIVQEVLVKNTLENKIKKFFVYSQHGSITLFNESKNKDEDRKYIIGVAFAENPADITSKKLISYFSTDIYNPFPFMINATFELTADRNRLYKNNPFNVALLEKLNKFIFDVVKFQYINESKPNYDILKQLIFFDNKFLTDEEEGYNFGELFNHNLITYELIPTKYNYYSLNQGLIKLNHDFYSIVSKYPNYNDLIVFSNDTEIQKFLISRMEIKNITSDQLTKRLNDTIQNTNISRQEILELSVLYLKEFGLNSEDDVVENTICPRFFINNDNEYLASSVKKYISSNLKGNYQKVCEIIGATLVNEKEISIFDEMCKKYDVDYNYYEKYYNFERLLNNNFILFVSNRLNKKKINTKFYSIILKYFKENYTLSELSAARESFIEDNENENGYFSLLMPVVINDNVYKSFVCFNTGRKYNVNYYKFVNFVCVNETKFPIHYLEIDDDYEFYRSIGVIQLDNHTGDIKKTIEAMNINTIDLVKESNKFLAITNQTINPLSNWKIISDGTIKSADSIYRNDKLVSEEIYKKLNYSICDYEETFGEYVNKGKKILEDKLKHVTISELFITACNKNYIDIMYKIFKDKRNELPQTFSGEAKLYSGKTTYSSNELFFDNDDYALILSKLPNIKILNESSYSAYGCSKEFFEYLGVKKITVEVIESNIQTSTDKIVLPFLYFYLKDKVVLNDLKSIFGDYKYYSMNENTEEIYLKKLNVRYLKYSDIYKKMSDNGCDKKMLDEYLENYIKKIGYKLVDEDCVIQEFIDTVNDIDRIKKCDKEIYKIFYKDFYLKGKIPVDKIKNLYLPTIDGEYVSNSEGLYYLLSDELLDDLKGKKLHIIHLDFVENNNFYNDLRINQLAKENLKVMISKTNDKIKLPFLFYIEYNEIILNENEIKNTFGNAKYINKDEHELANVFKKIGVDFINYYEIKKIFDGKFKNPEIIDNKLTSYLKECGYEFISNIHVKKEIIKKIKMLDNEINDFSHKYYYENIFMNSKSVETDVFGFKIHTNNGYKISSDKIVFIPDKEWEKWIPKSLPYLNIAKIGFVPTINYYAKIGVKEASKLDYIHIINEEYKVISHESLMHFTKFILKQNIIDNSAIPKINFIFDIGEKSYQCNQIVYTNDFLEQKVYDVIGQPWISRQFIEKIASKEKITVVEKYTKFKQILEPEYFVMFLNALKNGLLIEQKELIKQLKRFHSNKNNAFEEQIVNSNLLPAIDYYSFDEYKVNLLKEINSSISVLLIVPEEEELFKALGKNALPNNVFYSEIAKSLSNDKIGSNHNEKINLLYNSFKNEPNDFKYAVENCKKTINLMVNNKSELVSSSKVYFGLDYGNPLLEKVLFHPFNNFLSSEYLKMIDDNIENIKLFFNAFMVTDKIKRHSVNLSAVKLHKYEYFKQNIQIGINKNVRIDIIESFKSTMDNARLDYLLEFIDINQDIIFAETNINYYGPNNKEIKKLLKSSNEIQLIENYWIKIDEKYYKPSNCTIIPKYDLSPCYKYCEKLDKYKNKSWFSKLNVLTKLDDLNILDFYEILCNWNNNDTKKTSDFYFEMCRIYENKNIDFSRKDIRKSRENLKFNSQLLGCKNNKYGFYNSDELVIVDRTITNHPLDDVPQFLPDYRNKNHLKKMFDVKYISEVNIEEATCVKSLFADSIIDILTKKLNFFSFLFKDVSFSSKINVCFLQTGEFYINGTLVKLNNYEYLIDLKSSTIYFDLPDEIININSLVDDQKLLKTLVDAFANLSGGTAAMTILTILLLDESEVSTYLKMIDNKPIDNDKEIKFNLVAPKKRSIFSKIKYILKN